jgi:hypothetical protein
LEAANKKQQAITSAGISNLKDIKKKTQNAENPCML